MIKNTAHNRKPLLPSVPDQTSSRSSTNTSITGGEDVANNFDDEWTTGNWCYVLPATPCSSGVAAAATAAAAAAATTLIHGTSLSTEDNDDDDTKIRHPPVDEISSGNTTEATNDDAADDDSAAAWEAGNWCWQQREEEKEEYCVRSGDRSCTKRKRNKQEQNNISTCDSRKVETNDDDGVGDEDTMHGNGRGAAAAAAAAVINGTSISTDDNDKIQHPPVVKNDATTKTAIWNPSIPTPQYDRPLPIQSCTTTTTTEAVDTVTEDKYAAWEAGYWCWQQAMEEEEKEEPCVRSIKDPSRKKRRRNNEGKVITSRSNQIKLEENNDGNDATPENVGSANNTRNVASAVSSNQYREEKRNGTNNCNNNSEVVKKQAEGIPIMQEEEEEANRRLRRQEETLRAELRSQAVARRAEPYHANYYIRRNRMIQGAARADPRAEVQQASHARRAASSSSRRNRMILAGLRIARVRTFHIDTLRADPRAEGQHVPHARATTAASKSTTFKVTNEEKIDPSSFLYLIRLDLTGKYNCSPPPKHSSGTIEWPCLVLPDFGQGKLYHKRLYPMQHELQQRLTHECNKVTTIRNEHKGQVTILPLGDGLGCCPIEVCKRKNWPLFGVLDDFDSSVITINKGGKLKFTPLLDDNVFYLWKKLTRNKLSRVPAFKNALMEMYRLLSFDIDCETNGNADVFGVGVGAGAGAGAGAKRQRTVNTQEETHKQAQLTNTVRQVVPQSAIRDEN